MQSIKPIYNIEFKRNSRQQFAPTINKNDVNAIVNEFNISNGDMLYLYTADSHDAIQDMQIKYNELNENIKFIKAGTDDDAKKYKNLYDDVSAELDNLKTKYDALKSKKDDALNELSNTQDDYTELDDKYSALKSDYSILQKELDDVKEHNNTLLDDASAYDDKIAELEKSLKNAKDNASNVDDDLSKAKRHLFDAESKRNDLLNTIDNQNTIINERTNQLKQLQDDYKQLQTKYNDKVIELTDKFNHEVKSNADKISKLSAGIQYIDDKLSNTNKIIRWIGGFDKAIERIQDIKSIQASAEPKAIDTIKYGVPDDVNDDAK